MPPPELRLSPRAERDLDEIWDYTNDRYGAAAADSYVRSFNDVFGMLTRHPKAGAVEPALRPRIRSFRHRSHRLFYRETEERIDILTIRHHARDDLRSI